MYDEAADWLYALRTVRFWSGDVTGDEQHPLAQALTPAAVPSRLPGSPHTSALALRAMIEPDKPREALQRVRRWRWQAVVRAQLTEELEATRLLGTLLQRHGEVAAAVGCFVRAGTAKEAAAAARDLPEAAVDLDLRLLSPVQACRAAAFAAVAEAADLLDDRNAGAWADAAIDEISAGHEERLGDPTARLSAFDALTAFADVLSDGQLDTVLDIVEPLIDRAAGRHRHTDSAVTKILLAAATRGADVVPLLARAVLADQQMAATALAGTHFLPPENQKALGELLAAAAATSEYAGLVVVVTGAGPGCVLEAARDRVDRYLAAREHRPGETAFYTGSTHVAIFASVLEVELRDRVARTMLDRAADRREATPSRQDSLRGLLALSSYASEQTRSELMPRLLEMARGEHDGGPADDIIERHTDPFGMFTIVPGQLTLSGLALECAGHFAANNGDHAAIAQIGTALLRTADEPGQWRISRAFAQLSGAADVLDLRQCAVHPFPAVRAMAALCWAKDPGSLPAAAAVQLAGDDDHRVRQVLARAVRDHRHPAVDDDSFTTVVTALSGDARRSVRSAAIP